MKEITSEPAGALRGPGPLDVGTEAGARLLEEAVGLVAAGVNPQLADVETAVAALAEARAVTPY
ncbi:hypothetical protein O7599_30120 [Streptomyces sp. WMMC500]|uniref:hypothetical protein n=1 Tax=Streptomyces sp. WMMC500 TaxID=3015154 RepID=UPI00248CC854|nr:hypothetical protein [Streptomyces sp. WMMC500]WBB59766.1 hypothetical protein O7599_30120 [Streptomyces sp. WMMC500]